MRQVIGNRESNATRASLFIAGFGISSWAPLVPIVKERAALNEGTLGLLLLFIGVGSFVAMPLASLFATRYGCRKPIVFSVLLIMLALPLLALIQTPWMLGVVLFMFGCGLGGVEVVANLQAVEVEKAFNKPMMSGFHGMWSIGGMTGAIAVSAFFWLDASPLLSMIIVFALIGALLVWSLGGLLPTPVVSSGSRSAMPHGVVIVLGMLAFSVFLAEGAVLDWSAIYLRETRSVEHAYAGLGYGLFAIAMTFGRLTGDRLISRFGQQLVVVGGGVVAAIGFVIVVTVSSPMASMFGFLLVGLGASNLAPIMFSAAGKQTRMSETAAIGAVTAMGYAGVVIGPGLVGFFAHAFSLGTSFVGISILFLLIAMSSKVVASVK